MMGKAGEEDDYDDDLYEEEQQEVTVEEIHRVSILYYRSSGG